MRYSGFLRRCFCLVLALLLLPMPAARGADAGDLVTVQAQSVFEDQLLLLELYSADTGYYIDLQEAGRLSGLTPQGTAASLRFAGQYVSVPVDLDAVPSLTFQGTEYYALEPLMEQLHVYLFESGGMLMFNSPEYNLDRLLTPLHDAVLCGRFDADYLRDIPEIGDAAYLFARLYNAILGFDLNIYGTYQEEVRSLLLELVTPLEGESVFNPFTLLEKANKKLNKAAKYILKAEDVYENAREFLYEIPAGGDILLFGVEGSRYLRESLEAVQAVNKLDLSQVILKTFLGYSEWSEYSEALKDLDLDLDASVDMFSLSDLISLFGYYVDVTAADGTYIRALDQVLRRQGIGSLGALDVARRSIICQEGSQLVADYKNYIRSNIAGVFASTTGEFLETVLSNATEDILVNVDLYTRLKVTLSVTLFTKWLDSVGQTETTKKMEAITRMYEFSHIQSLFADFLETALTDPRPENAEAYKSAAVLYLKCAWHSIDSFSYSNLPLDGVPVGRIEQVIEETAAAVMEYPDFEFRVVAPAPIPGGSLTDLTARELSLSDPSLASCLSVSYADSCHFATDWGEELSCTYEVPQLSDSLLCAPEVNRRILSLFRNYVSGRDGALLLHGPELFSFSDPLDTEAFFRASSAWEDPRILQSLTWEAYRYDSILSLRVTGLWFDPGSLAFLFDDEYSVFNIDLETGQELSSGEVLARIGLSEADLDSRIELRLREMSGPLSGDLTQEQRSTLAYNPFSEILERGLFLTPEGLRLWVYLDTGSRYIYKSPLVLDLWGEFGIRNSISLPSGGEPAPDFEPEPAAPAEGGQGVQVGPDYCYFLAPESWEGHFFIEQYDPWTFGIFNTDNFFDGPGGHLCDVYISTELQSPQQLLDTVLAISEETAENALYFGTWSGGIIYGLRDEYGGVASYHLDDPALSSVYLSMREDLSDFRNHLVLDESVLPYLATDFEE